MARMRYGPRFGGGGIERSQVVDGSYPLRLLPHPTATGPNGTLQALAPSNRAHGWCVFRRRYFRSGSSLKLVAGPFETELQATFEAEYFSKWGARVEVLKT